MRPTRSVPNTHISERPPRFFLLERFFLFPQKSEVYPMQFWDFHTHQVKSSAVVFNDASTPIPETGFFSVGIHPWQVDIHWDERLQEIQQISKHNLQVLAIGEAGFDRLKGPETPLQKAAFYAQARWAKTLEIPLILHCVKAHDLLLEYFKSDPNPPVIIWHGWNLKPDLARLLLPNPLYFSFGRHLLSPESNAAKWLFECPRDRIFLETDDSGLEIDSIYKAASLILRLPVEEVAELTVANWNRISKRKINE